ncbi:MAG: hypothetical protein PHY78_13780, partial [Desulfobacterales bacterium]|nr:hypothetical protein [Desulfobacterales bacterium]
NMPHTRIQIYEIQTPEEANQMIDLGVDHIGSVIVSEKGWKSPELRATIDQVRSSSSKSSLIPLFSHPDSIFRTLDYYQPDIVHFCESLYDPTGNENICRPLIRLQEQIKKKFPEISIMRSVPITPRQMSSLVPTLRIAQLFEAVSDFFLTDTIMIDKQVPPADNRQPVNGFVGLTGQTGDWDLAAQLVASSKIPVILAGGISPDNVYDGIRRIRPFGVDSCTRTNAVNPGGKAIRFKKDPDKVSRLIGEVRRADQDMDGNIC